MQYRNAKVVLVGDTGVGKSGLGLVLTGNPFAPTESTHGRQVWSLEEGEQKLSSGEIETRETLLWDLAGQPGYRLIHQLSLSEVAVAVIVFDARSEIDPFAGVRHWRRALTQAARASEGGFATRCFLVAARTDRGPIGVSRNRIDAVIAQLGFDGYFDTSAREGIGIGELRRAIAEAIPWDELPVVKSSELFQRIKTFLLREKEAGHLLTTADELYRSFIATTPGQGDVRPEFDTAMGRLEARGLMRRLSFGGLVLLQPELLDAYASALVNAAKDEPDGMGSIGEDDARAGAFRMPSELRMANVDQERLLLIATIEDLLRYEVGLREQSEEGSYLVFPSQLTRENPELPDPKGKTVMFRFEGPILNVYATLAVRLSHSGMFARDEMWENAIVFSAKAGGACGMFMREIGEAQGEISCFFGKETGPETRLYFEEYVRTHLQRRALRETVTRHPVYACPVCKTPLHDAAVQGRRERGFDWIPCNVCGEPRISLADGPGLPLAVRSTVLAAMDSKADTERERAAATAQLEGKRATSDFDVFLSYRRSDRNEVRLVGDLLEQEGILPWLDVAEVRPGQIWQKVLEDQIGRIKSAAVFVGAGGLGPWQEEEMYAFLQEFHRRGSPVIPVLLPTAPREPRLPVLLRNRDWVDLRRPRREALDSLIWAVTGQRPKPRLDSPSLTD